MKKSLSLISLLSLVSFSCYSQAFREKFDKIDYGNGYSYSTNVQNALHWGAAPACPRLGQSNEQSQRGCKW
ncbi:MAG: hypothetical protein RI955_449 [Bacteroidota bacterium]|jgi:hypothetical protein